MNQPRTRDLRAPAIAPRAWARRVVLLLLAVGAALAWIGAGTDAGAGEGKEKRRKKDKPADPPGPTATVALVAATPFGTPWDDRFEDVAFAGDGSLYAVGNLAAPLPAYPGHLRAQRVVHGTQDPDWAYGPAMILHLSEDGARLLHYAEFAPGTLRLTSVLPTRDAVYLGGYAGPGLASLIADKGGVRRSAKYPQRGLPWVFPPEHWTDPYVNPDNDQRGAPCVLRLSPDLKTILGGTYLEGWQSTWHVPTPLGEDLGQPVGLGLLPGGDVVVSHDGGTFRVPEGGDPKAARHPFDFYGVPDYLSRLAPDLTERRWMIEIETPQTPPELVNQYLTNKQHFQKTPPIAWTRDWLGQTRILRLRTSPEGQILIGGVSPTRTSEEPWWSPFCRLYDGGGKLLWKSLNPDPQSGEKHRMSHFVSDTAVRSVAWGADPTKARDDEEKAAPGGDGRTVLVAAIADGGNTVMRRDPLDWRKALAPDIQNPPRAYFPGRMLYWGTVLRLRGEDGSYIAGRGMQGYRPPSSNHRNRRLRRPTTSAGWATDIVGLPEERVAIIGRHKGYIDTTPGALFEAPSPDGTGERPWGGFFQLCVPAMRMPYATRLPGVTPLTMAARGNRVALVGYAEPTAPRRKPLLSRHLGQRDAYLMVLDITWQDPPPKELSKDANKDVTEDATEDKTAGNE